MHKILSFLFGLILSVSFTILCMNPNAFNTKFSRNVQVANEKLSYLNLYNETLADKLFNEVKILCWVMTTPANHKTKAIYVKKTWGKRCNKLLFMSTKTDLELGTIALPVKEGRNTLWDKTKFAFLYVYKHHIDDADWFLKADDDNFMIIENIRYLLYQYRPQTALYFGHRYVVEQIPEGYMAGGGYILSKKALQKFATKIIQNSTVCKSEESGNEDWEMGKCLQHSAISVDERDETMAKRFFPVGVIEHLTNKVKDPNYWYVKSQYYEVPQGSLTCCSDTPAAFHYVNTHEMFLLEYLTRIVHPFGLEKNLTETLPKKLTLKEILQKSDLDSASANFRKHQIYHDFENSEKIEK